MKKVKVCVIGTRGFPYIQGGVEKHCEMLYPLFSSAYEFIVFRRKPYVNDKVKVASFPNVRFIDLPSTRIKGLETVIHSFLATLYTIFLFPDFVHIHNIAPAFYSPLLRLVGVKVVLTYHSANYKHHKWGLLARILLRISEWIALHCSNQIIFVNRSRMSECSEKIRTKSIYIPNGVTSVIPSSTTTLIRFGLKEREYILFVGRITHEKGLDVLIRSYLKAKRQNCKLVIVGGVDTEFAYYRELTSISNTADIIFTGALYGDELSQLYTHACLFVLPSREEGFPLVLLEAMSYGLEILVSDIPAIRILPIPAECYFPKEDIDALSELMSVKIITNQRRSYDLREYTWNSVQKKVQTVFEKVQSINL